MADSHAGWDSMRVNDHVRCDALNREGQVLLTIRHSTGTLLTVTTGELVTNLRDFDSSHLDFDEAPCFLVHREAHLVDVALFRMLEWN